MIIRTKVLFVSNRLTSAYLFHWRKLLDFHSSSSFPSNGFMTCNNNNSTYHSTSLTCVGNADFRRFSTLSFPTRSLHSSCVGQKGKDKAKKAHKGKAINVDMTIEELGEIINTNRLFREMDYIMESYKESLANAVAVRTNIASLETLPVDYEGDTFPLNELVQVNRKSPTLVILNCSPFPDAIKPILKAIQESGMNLNPQQDGITVSIQIPKVTKEHRETLAAKAKELFNKNKLKLRDVQNTFTQKLSDKKALGEHSEDVIHRALLKVREIYEEKVTEAEKLLKDKNSEILN